VIWVLTRSKVVLFRVCASPFGGFSRRLLFGVLAGFLPYGGFF
jgi:hypothetical protein